MEEMDLISKKELLQLTNISYGQLYRWKRENLIPESWFIKKSSFTGQETFFQREKILNRVNEILNLKDRYSLEELADMISPELTKRVFYSAEIKKIKQLNPEIIDQFEVVLKKNFFGYLEFIFIFILSKIGQEFHFNDVQIQEMIESSRAWAEVLKDTSYRFMILAKKQDYIFLLAGQDSKCYYDSNTREIKVIDLEETAKELSLILKEI
jgi:hypothetical protein